MPVRPSSRGSVSVYQALLLGPVPLAFLVWFQDWYVDVNAPSCAMGTGTQADPFCDIMDAVAAAADGDTIHIAPGTYFENVVIDEDLSLVGTGGDLVTILDGMASGSVVRVVGVDVTLTGLTLTNGSGTGGRGGGLFADDDGDYYNDLPRVSLASCTVTANALASGVGAALQGGGLFVLGGPLTLTDTTVSSNTITSSGAFADARAGGILARELVLTNSTVTGNLCLASGDFASTRGGGIWAYYLSVTVSEVTSNGCHSTGYYSFSGGGGVLSFSATIEQADVSQNACTSDRDSVGGGVAAAVTMLVSSTVAGNVVAGEHASGGGILGAPFAGSGCPGNSYITIQNSSVSENSALGTGIGRGGGILNRGHVTITNSTVASNSTTGTGSGIQIFGGGSYYEDLTLTNSIVWGSASPVTLSSSGLCGGSPTSTIEYSLVQGGWPGAGNIDADPLFADPLSGNFRLLQGSPCIDAGSNAAVPLDILLDLDGRNRFIEDSLTPDTGRPGRMRPLVDMGAYEGPHFPGRRVRRR